MKTTKKRSRRKAPTIEEFVRAWQTAENIGEVAKRFGMKYGTACSLASRLRKKGVPLKKYYRPRLMYRGVNISKLAKLARSFQK